MSNPSATSDHQKKRHRGPRRRNAATSNPPRVEEAQSQVPAYPSRVSQASHLLAQLAAAQGSNVVSLQPSTSHMNTPKAKENSSKNQKQARSEDRGKSVGARMSAKHPPPPAPSSRNRTTSQSANKQNDVTYRGPRIPEDVLDSISFRFIMNIPDSERLDETRICFQIELAHWFYIDFYVNQEERTDCINIGMRDFLKQIFSHNDFLRRLYYRSDEILDNWRNYKSTVPTYGGILLDSSLNHMLLVQGFYASKNSWGFPKGKVNESECPRECAIREVREETGFDFGDHSNGNEFKIQKMVNDTMIRLYVVKDVPMDYKFEPQTRCEIRKMKWFNIWDLPLDRNDQLAANKGFHPKHFYGVVPFVQDLQNYVKREEKKREKEGKTKKGVTLNNGKKNSAFTKVEKKSPCERAWMESVVVGGVNESVKYGDDTPSTSETLFKPLGETGGAPPGSNLAMILAHSSAGSTPRNASTSKTAVAHPVAIRPCDHPVYEAPLKEDKCKVAANLIANLWTAVPSSSAQSATQIEDTLNKILFNAPVDVSHVMDPSKTPTQRDSSIDGDEEVKECVPTLSQEPSLPPLNDLCISVDGVYPSGLIDLPSTSSHSHSHSLTSSTFRRHSVSSSILSPAIKNRCPFELVPAWKSFKLNREKIFEEISSFFM